MNYARQLEEKGNEYGLDNGVSQAFRLIRKKLSSIESNTVKTIKAAGLSETDLSIKLKEKTETEH